MDVLYVSPAFSKFKSFAILKPQRNPIHHLPINLKLPNSSYKTPHSIILSSSSSSSFSFCNYFSSRVFATSTATDTSFVSSSTDNRHWIVIMEKPPQGVDSRKQVIDYYVQTLQGVLGRYIVLWILLCTNSLFLLFIFSLLYLKLLRIWFLQWGRSSNVYLWCFLGYPLRFLLWHRWRNFHPARS